MKRSERLVGVTDFSASERRYKVSLEMIQTGEKGDAGRTLTAQHSWEKVRVT